MAHLYINSKGVPVSANSYSSGALFTTCAYKYYLLKIKGYRRKDNSAATRFGRAVEDAIQFYHANSLLLGSGIDEFKRLWLASKEVEGLRYTNREGDWASMYRAGAEMLRLYEILLPTLPIVNPVFQANARKEVFPGTELAGLEDQGFLDMVSKAPWVHPMLPRVEIPKGAAHRPLVIDIKTSGVALDEDHPELLTLDPQLRRYAWLSGLLDLGFLWFVKSLPTNYERGTAVTLLEASGGWATGEKAVIAEYNDEDETAHLARPDDYDALKFELSEIKGKGSTERKAALIATRKENGILITLPDHAFTRQRLQFQAVHLTPEDLIEAGNTVARELVDIHAAGQTGIYLKKPGVRFPANHCTFCECRGICLKNDRLRDDLLIQIQPAATDNDDWLAEMEEG